MPKQPLLLPSSARRDAPFPGLSIYTRFVVRILGFERVVCGSSQMRIGFGAENLLQRSYSAGVLWLGTQPADGTLSYTPIRV